MTQMGKRMTRNETLNDKNGTKIENCTTGMVKCMKTKK